MINMVSVSLIRSAVCNLLCIFCECGCDSPEVTRPCFLLPPSIKLYLPGLFICIQFSSHRCEIESPLDHNTLLTNCTDVPPFCPHFVCKLILEGWGELSHALSSSACFPHFVLTRRASLNRLSVSILAILYGGRVCPAPQTSPYRFFNSFFSSFVECDIFDDCDLLQGCFTQANNYLRWGEHRESCSSTHSPLSPNQSTLPITLCQST